MKALRLEQELAKLTETPAGEDKPHLAFEMRKSDQEKGISFYNLMVPMGNIAFHRADFLRILAEQLDPEITTSHFFKRLTSYSLPSASSPSSPLILNFKDGTTATCDVLIGSDGIHSATRHTLLELAAKDAEADGAEDGMKAAAVLRGMVEPVWSGSVAYRGVIPREKLEKLNPNHRAMHTAQNGRTVEERTKSELLEQYVGWEEEVQQLLQCIDKPSRWAINALKGIPIYSHDRVALMGDAAHAMTPHQGSGAGQAIEDAYILASILTHQLTTRETLPASLKVYEAVCLPHGNEVQWRSWQNGKLYEFADPRFANLDFSDGANSKCIRTCIYVTTIV
ncbi:hypothetical protein DFH11DRAFT_1790494 [Phellopilus nigrolimitatus]|nr:hypothetical protein DFH11DRAFT_1790494 [Phellopilus nigrolimitatus]